MTDGVQGQDVVDLGEGQRLAEEGMTRASRRASPAWCQRFDAAVGNLAAAGAPFTADDVVAALGGVPEPGEASRNAIGGRMIVAAKRGLITPVGFRKSRRVGRRGGACRLWAGTARARE